MRVHELMTPAPCRCSIHDSAQTAAQLMWEHDCGIVPVVADDGRLAGVVTDRDLCMAALLQGTRLAEIPVETCMSRELSACRPGDALIDAEQKMQMRQVHRLPVVDEVGRPIGILSLSDVVRRIPVRNGAHKGDPIEEFIATVATIAQPRVSAS